MILRKKSFLFSLGLALTLSAVPAFAEETGSGASASGTEVIDVSVALPQKLSALHTALNERIPETRIDVLLPAPKIAGWQSEIARNVEKSRTDRAYCRDAIRQANRDTLIDRASTCMRADLMQEISFLRKQSSYVATLPFLDATLLADAKARISTLIDADMTVVGAIDAGLYLQTDQLLDAKKKLTDQYRLPYWNAMIKVRADRQLVWVGLMVRRLDEVLKEGNNTDAILDMMYQGAVCLDESRLKEQAILNSSDLESAVKLLPEEQKLLKACRETMWNVGHLKLRQFESEKAAEASKNAKGTK